MNVLSFLTPVVVPSTPRPKKSTQLENFLHHLNHMFQRISPSALDGNMGELRDAMKRQLDGSFRSSGAGKSSPASQSFRKLEDTSYEYKKKMLDELASKTLRSPNALERELKCDRFIAAYCALEQLNEKIDSQERSSANFERSFYLREALDYELNPIASEDSADKDYTPQDMRRMMLMSRAKTPTTSARLALSDPRTMELKRQRSMRAMSVMASPSQSISSLACRGLMQYT
eukprot:gene35386-42891_t